MLKNYTSSVPAKKSIAHIEDCLAAHGANSVVKQYDESRTVCAISFFIEIKGKLCPFRLPAKIDNVEKILLSSIKKFMPSTHKRIKEQAPKTAWKIISDWVDAQMALVELEQADFIEIFMPYMWSQKLGKSYYELSLEKGFALLSAPK